MEENSRDALVDDSGWRAQLDLTFCHREPRTVLARNLHNGPLRVQKALYPEGPGICHVAILHPPGGIVSGDSLTCHARLEERARVCLTTPGATKWYRCPEASSRQHLRFSLARGASLEWLPRENILFDGSRIHMQLEVELDTGATYIGWEILCFGRRASGERWRTGGLTLGARVRHEGRLLWSERANILAASGFATSPVGLAGFTVSATLVIAGPQTDAMLLANCRQILPGDGTAQSGITSLPSLLLARYLGHSSEDAFNWLTSLWRLLRPAHLQVPAAAPRLWAC